MPRTRSAGLRDHLVAATDELLDQAAPGALTTRQIAAHAAVSDGVLYNHFGDKEELLVAALTRRYARLVGEFEAHLAAATATATSRAGSLGVDASLEGFIGSFAVALRDLEAAALHLGAGLLAEPALLQAFWVEMHRPPLGLDRLERPLLERLRAEQASVALRGAADVGAAVSLVFGLAAMSALGLRLNPGADRAAADRRLAAGVGVICAGLRSG
jgi:AcrR family transcriptional regulator